MQPRASISMTTRVFISGISGFIGGALSRRLTKLGMEVSGLSRHRGGPGVLSGDILDCPRYESQIADAELVIHLAAPTTARDINTDPLAAMKTSLVGTHSLLEIFAEGAGKHFIYFSSGKVYGNHQKLPFNEKQIPNPSSVLGQSKRAAEQMIEFYAEHTPKCYSIIRLFNAYGPGQREGFLIPAILEQLSKTDVKLGDTSGKRDFIYIDDVVEAVETLIAKRTGAGCETYNAGSGLSHSPAEIITLLEGLLGKKVKVTTDSTRMRTGEPDEERADIQKLKQLGWSAKMDLKAGLKATLEASRIALA